MDRLADRTAIVTGGAIGLGAIYSQALAHEGAKLVLADIADAEPIADEIRSRHGPSRAHVIETKVARERLHDRPDHCGRWRVYQYPK